MCVLLCDGCVLQSVILQGNEHFKQLQQRVSSALKQGTKRLRSKIDSLQQQMGSSDDSQDIQKQADLLTANLYRCLPHTHAACICAPVCFLCGSQERTISVPE